MSVMSPVLKYPGSKWKLAKWIIEHMPRHDVYLEPFFGSGAVFFAKQPSMVETINDVDGNVVNLFKTIREHPEDLARLIEYTPWSRKEYENSYVPAGDSLENARRFMVRCWQAFGSKVGQRTGWRNDIQGLRGTSCPATWRDVPKRIFAVADRLRNAQIECRPAVDIIKNYNYPNVLIYADPPYLLSTRSSKIYACEMTDQDHIDLLEALIDHSGPVIISGYDNELYNEMLKRWTRQSARALAETGKIKTEVIWINPTAAVVLNKTLF